MNNECGNSQNKNYVKVWFGKHMVAVKKVVEGSGV